MIMTEQNTGFSLPEGHEKELFAPLSLTRADCCQNIDRLRADASNRSQE